MRIIIVDDEPKIRHGIKKFLMKHTHMEVVGVFENAKNVFAFLDTDYADVIITDIKMPEVSGLELIEKIREKNNEIDIIILSGYGDFSYAQKAIELGVIRYLTKPTNPLLLLETLENVEKKLTEKKKQKFGEDDKTESEISNLIVMKAIEYIESHYNSKITLKEMSEELFISPNYLCELFKKHTNKTLSEYMVDIRMRMAREYLEKLDYKISEVAELVGFSDPKYFSSTFKKIYGMRPMEYRNNHHKSG